MLFCMSVKLGRSHLGKNMGWGCSWMRSWRRYLGVSGRKRQEEEESCILRIVVIFDHYQLRLGSYNQFGHGRLRMLHVSW